METHFQTSFIPKKPLQETTEAYQSAPIGIFFIVSLVFIAVAILSTIGVYGYKFILSKQLEGRKDSIVQAQAAINTDELLTFTKLSNKVKVASLLLDSHLSISNIFNILEKSTLKTVRFTNFSLSYAGPDKINLTMSGQAKNYYSVADQADTFSNSTTTKPIFKNAIISNLSLDESGNVSFSFSTLLDPSAISYLKHFKDNDETTNSFNANEAQSTNPNNIQQQSVVTPTPTSTKPVVSAPGTSGSSSKTGGGSTLLPPVKSQTATTSSQTTATSSSSNLPVIPNDTTDQP